MCSQPLGTPPPHRPVKQDVQKEGETAYGTGHSAARQGDTEIAVCSLPGFLSLPKTHTLHRLNFHPSAITPGLSHLLILAHVLPSALPSTLWQAPSNLNSHLNSPKTRIPPKSDQWSLEERSICLSSPCPRRHSMDHHSLDTLGWACLGTICEGLKMFAEQR